MTSANDQGGSDDEDTGLQELDELPDVQQAELLAEFDRRRRARQIHVSTDDTEVKLNLRQLSEPICLFGEGAPERRERLKAICSLLSDDEIARKLRKKEADEKREEDAQNEVTWYHEGSDALLQSRFWLADYSLREAKKRISYQHIVDGGDSKERSVKMQQDYQQIRGFGNYCSQVGDSRPLSSCKFSPDSQMMLVGSWSGLCKLWSVPDCSLLKTFSGHGAQVSSVSFHPQSTLGLDAEAANCVSTGFDGDVRLWSLASETCLAQLKDKDEDSSTTTTNNRVSRAEFHPSGRMLGTCCHDNSWRLWDIERREELLHQEGHSRPVLDMSFQCDGSLCVTGGHDAYGRVWDLRTGRCIMFMDGHLKSILSVDFHPNGYHIATGSEDNSAKIWDLRQTKCIYTIPAHKNLVSKVKFQKNNGNFLITSSYDYMIKVWTHPTWTPIKELKGHEQKVMGCDISADSKWIVSCSYDKTFKLWSKEY